MFSIAFFTSVLLLAVQVSTSPISQRDTEAAQVCEGEAYERNCYTQDLNITDIKLALAGLRLYTGLFTMPYNSSREPCEEWTVWSSDKNTVMITAKHLNKRNTSVLYDDIISTINGGPGANSTKRDQYLGGCTKKDEKGNIIAYTGGSMATYIRNPKAAEYTNSNFTNSVSNFTTEGIIIKLVRNTDVITLPPSNDGWGF
jgi:hypothetical protein